MKKFLAMSMGVLLTFSLGIGGCKKKEQQPVPQAPQMTPGGQMPPGAMPPGAPMPPGGQMPPGQGGPGMNVPKGELSIAVPDSVKGKWSAVKLVVEDKATKKKQEFTVNLNSELKIPNSNLKIAVGDFLPEFRMDAQTITSASNEPKNPAVRVKVFEGDKVIFKGWLYSKFPTIHPFEHPKYGLALKEGVKKG
jgi:hypothetical protein